MVPRPKWLRRFFPLALIAAVGTTSAAGATPGAPDGSFGQRGIVTGSAGAQLFAVAAEPDRSLLAAGTRNGKVFAEHLSRTGALLASYTGPPGFAKATAIARDGGVVLAGATANGGILMERLSPHLTLDRHFGSKGFVTAFVGPPGQANAVGIGSDGSIVAAGWSGIAAQAAVVRVSSSGRLIWQKPVDLGPESQVDGLAVQPKDGHIVLVGRQQPLQFTNGVVARLTPAGGLDRTFAGGRGAFTYNAPDTGYTGFNAVALASGGKILAAGVSAQGPTMILMRLKSNGSLDSSFGRRGVVAAASGQNVTLQNYPIGAYGVAEASRGRLVTVGQFENGGGADDVALWGFNETGSPMRSFGSRGVERYPLNDDEACAVALDAAGQIVIAGDTIPRMPDFQPCNVRSGSQGFVARYSGLR